MNMRLIYIFYKTNETVVYFQVLGLVKPNAKCQDSIFKHPVGNNNSISCEPTICNLL